MKKTLKKNRRKEPENPVPPDQTNVPVYIYDKKIKQWKMVNPSGSIAYNCLTRDEWSWLD